MTSKEYPGVVLCGAKPLQKWQVDYIGSLPTDQGYHYVFTSVDTATSLGFVWLVETADEHHTVTTLEHLAAAYG